MALAVGSRIGSYEVTGQIGAGGMGEVYRARDLKLNRDVAIKVLPEAFAVDSDRLARFKREAQVLAALNHSNIAQIYGFEDSASTHALVLELVDGPTLADRIAQGPIAVAEAVPIAAQIALALEAAHDLGIVHRDLKPANVKVREDGAVKVLDFGLAKALSPEGAGAAADAMNSPTLTARATQLGVILGTAAYMAPEQAKGKVVDRRADIWAFGCVLYEMLAGKRAFEGDDVSETLASVLRSDIDWSAMPADAPAPLVDLIRRCLERDVRQRLQAIGEARILLGRPLDTATRPSAATAPAPAHARAPHVIWLVLAAALGAALAVVALRPWQPTPVTGVARKFLIATDVPPDNLALSPDGRRVLFSAGTKLLVRDLDQLQARELPGVGSVGTGTATDSQTPAWSPDGTSVVYASNGKIWRVAAAGGTPTLICDSPGVFRGAAWKPDNSIVLAMTRGPMYQVSANGGEPRVLLPLDGKDDVDFHNPFVLPDGQSLLYSVHRRQGVDTIEVFSGGTRKVVMRLEGRTRSSPQLLNWPLYSQGHLVYRLEQGNAGVWAVPFSLETLSTSGEPFLVAAGGSRPSASVDGTLAYVSMEIDGPAQLAWFRPDGSLERQVGEPRIGLNSPRLSPDGRRIAFVANQPEPDVWVSNADGSGAIRLTFTPDQEGALAWVPGQNVVAFACGRTGGSAICAKNADGTGDTRVLVEQASVPVFSPDGSMLMHSTMGTAERGLKTLDLRTPGARSLEFLMTAETLQPVAVLSGNKFAVVWGYSGGRASTFLKPFPAGDAKWEVTGLGAEFPLLLAGGRTLGTLETRPDGRRALVAVPFETSHTVAFGPRRDLFTNLPESLSLEAGYDVSADGKRLLGIVPASTRPVQNGVVVVLHWLAEFTRRD